MSWSYTREETKFELLPEGVYRVRIKAADKAVSSAGNDMLIVQLEVSGSKKVLYKYIVFIEDKPQIANGQLTQIFDSFKDIKEGDLDTSHWIGKVGAAKIKHEEYNGEMREKISYFIRAEKQSDLPNWVDPESGMEQLGAGEDLPF